MSELTDLLERFRHGSDLVDEAVAGLSVEELDWRAAPDRWSVRQILCHLADSEIVGVDRFRRVIAEDNPTLMWYDEKAWAANLDYHRRAPQDCLESFRLTRSGNYSLLRELPEAAFARPGVHSQTGPLTLLDLLRTYTVHAESHARQIRETRHAFSASKT